MQRVPKDKPLPKAPKPKKAGEFVMAAPRIRAMQTRSYGKGLSSQAPVGPQVFGAGIGDTYD